MSTWSRRRFLQITGLAVAEVVLARGGVARGAIAGGDALATAREQLRTLVVERALIVDDPWVLMHAVLPLGADARHGGVPILELVMRQWMAPVTRGATRYPAFPLGVEAHPNHFLEIMYAVDVPATRPFASPLGTTTRADLYAAARALFSPAITGSELSWTIIVFSAEMPPDDDRFENVDGRVLTVGALVETAMRAAEQGYAETLAAMRGEKPYGRSAIQHGNYGSSLRRKPCLTLVK
jgi:hypothetical protein